MARVEALQSNVWKFTLYNFIDHIRLVWMIKTLYLLWLGFSYTHMSVFEALVAGIIFVLEVPLGALADFIGKRRAVGISALVHGLGFVGMGLMNSPVQYYFIAVIMGVAFSFFSGSDIALIYDTLKRLKRTRDYKRIKGRINAIGHIGSIIGVFAGPALFLVNPRYGFLLTGVIYLLGAGVVWSMHEPYPSRRKFTLKSHWTQALSGLKLAATHMQVRWIILFFFLCHAGLELSFAFFEQPMLRSVGVGVETFGVFFALMIGVRAFAAYMAHYIETVLQENKSLLFILCSHVAVFWFLGSQVTIVVIAMLTLLHFLYGFQDIILEDYINAHIISARRATVLSVQSMFHNGAMVLIFLIVGNAIDSYDVFLVSRYFALSLGAASVLLWAYKKSSVKIA